MEYQDKILQGDALTVLKSLPDNLVDCIMTSPPYWGLRDYGAEGQLGLEKTFDEYIDKLCAIFDEAKRILLGSGTCWVNLGDTYANNQAAGTMKMGNPEFNKNRPCLENTKTPDRKCDLPDKCLCNIPARFSIEMCNRGWILRNVIIWHKRNCMPSSATDRFTVDFEYLYFFVQQEKYYFEQQLEDRERVWNSSKEITGKALTTQKGGKKRPDVSRTGRNKRTVWTINPKPYSEAHFAVYPEELCQTPIKAGCPEGGLVLDPFMGSGTTGLAAKKLQRHYLGIELNPEYIKLAEKRIGTWLF